MKDMAQWETLFLNYFQDNISDIQKKKKKTPWRTPEVSLFLNSDCVRE